MLIPSRFSNRPPHKRCAGLGRAETLWILVLSVAVVFAILGSLNSDRANRDLRETRDELRYLAGQISFALVQDEQRGESWPDVLIGNGEAPEGLGESAALRNYLPEHVFVPEDPHGRAYALRRVGPRRWVLQAADPQGDLIALDDEQALEEARGDETAIDIRLQEESSASSEG